MNTKLNISNKEKGYTLSELVTVIAIISILMAVFYAHRKGREMSALIQGTVDKVFFIYKACEDWRLANQKVDYVGISNTGVAPFYNGGFTTPYGGSITVSVSPTNPRKVRFTIDVTSVPQPFRDAMVRLFNNRGFNAVLSGNVVIAEK